MKKYIIIFILICLYSCNIFKHNKIIECKEKNIITVIHYNNFNNDSTIKNYQSPIYYDLEVIGKQIPNLVYIRWGRSSDPIKVKENWKNIEIGDFITIKESFYPKHKIEFIEFNK